MNRKKANKTLCLKNIIQDELTDGSREEAVLPSVLENMISFSRNVRVIILLVGILAVTLEIEKP